MFFYSLFFFIFSFLSLFFVSDSFSLWDFGTSHFRLFFLWFVEVGAAIKSGQQLMATQGDCYAGVGNEDEARGIHVPRRSSDRWEV